MRRRVPPLVWALGIALLVLAVGATLPLGDVTHYSAWEGHTRRASLWEACYWLPQTRREATETEFWACEARTVTNAGILLAVTAAAGCVAGWLARRRGRPLEAGDYRESPSGSVPDGRARPSAG
jgi:ABC-type Fe3+ transport system permease subunit